MRNVVAIAKKELNIYFTTPIAYAMFTVMTFIASYFFIAFVQEFLNTSMMAMQMPQYMDSNRLNLTDAVVAPLIFNCGIILVFVIPFLSMRLVSEEKRQKTFELLMTAPIRPGEIVLGKYLGGMAIVAVTILLVMAYPLVLQLFAGSSGTGGTGGIEWQTAFAGYLGLFLWAAAAMAIGLFISSLTESQVVAAIITFVVLLLLWIVSWMAQRTDGVGRDILMFMSASQHLISFVRGVFELKDAAYYLSVIVMGLFLTHRAVEAQRWS
ncbi:MAG: ABC transporter permease [Myxococcales bacterium]